MANEVLEIPVLPVYGNYRIGCPIEGTPYLFDFRWNSVDAAWFMDVLEVDVTPIIHGVKLVLGAYLGRRSNHRLFRQGVFVMVDTSGKGHPRHGKDANYNDFGTRVVLQYIPVLELIRRLRVVP